MADLHDRESTEETDFLPIDFSLVHADDEFLDALGSPEPPDSLADDKLAALLLSWRNDVDAEPIGELVDPKLAVATVHAAKIRQRRGSRLLAPLAAAAAVLAIIFAGVGLAARDAQPGDTLWGLTQVLYADHARSVEAAAQVRTDLREAEEALLNGKVAEAKSMLDEARHALPTVSSEDGKADLAAQHAALEAQLSDNPAADAPPPPAGTPTTVPPGSTGASPTSDPVQPSAPPTSTTDPSLPTVDPSETTTTSTEPGRIETTQAGEPPVTNPATNPATEPAKETSTGQG